MKGIWKKILTIVLTIGLVVGLLPVQMKAVDAETGLAEHQETFDFNGTDFDIVYASGATFGTDAGASVLSELDGVPEGYTDSVAGGGNPNYSAVAINFEDLIDLSKVTSFKVRMYVPEYSYSSAPAIRLLNVADTSQGYIGSAFVSELGGSFGAWSDIELLDLLNHATINKNSDGYLDTFILTLRCYASSAVTCYFDSVTITYTENCFVEKEEEVDESKLTLSFAGGGAQDANSRFLIYLDGITDTSDIYWNNNTVYIDGEAVSNNINYAVLGNQLALLLPYAALDTTYTSYTDVGKHMVQIKAGTSLAGGRFTVANDVWVSINGGALNDMEGINLTYAKGSAQDSGTRYLLYFDGITNTSDIYWNNNTVYIDGKAKSGEGVHYAVLEGMLALCLSYSHLEDNVNVATGMQKKHILTIPSGTILGGSYVLNETIMMELDGTVVTEIDVPDITVDLLNDDSRNGANCTSGFYFYTSAEDILEYDTANWTIRYNMIDDKNYINGVKNNSIEFIKLLPNLYYANLDTYLESAESLADGTVVTISGQIKEEDYVVEFNTASFLYRVETGWTLTEYTFSGEDVVYCLNDGDYIMPYANAMIGNEVIAEGSVYNVVGAHTVSYVENTMPHTCQLVLYYLGDADSSATVTLKDLMVMKKFCADATVATKAQLWAADLNGNGTISEVDVMLLREILLGSVNITVLSPFEGTLVAAASESVASLCADYDYNAYAVDALTTGGDIYHRDVVTLRWFGNALEYTVNVGGKTYTTDGNKLELTNLIPNTTYEWSVSDGTETSPVGRFTTADTIRTITIDGVSNTRDLGGYETQSGAIVKYGMVYRGANLDNVTKEGVEHLVNQLGVKTDLDLRGGYHASPVGEIANFYSYKAPWYWNDSTGLLNAEYQAELANAVRVFADKSNYPIYFHCAVGRDRTGTLALLINGLLGVEKEDLYLDYELSFLSRTGSMDGATARTLMSGAFDGLYSGLQSCAPEGTFAEACEAYLLSIGVTQDEIDSIRTILLD